jgi:CheY-like chemotaxis protein
LYEKNLLKDCCNERCERYYKLIIMDIGMPIKDGFEASREIISL